MARAPPMAKAHKVAKATLTESAQVAAQATRTLPVAQVSPGALAAIFSQEDKKSQRDVFIFEPVSQTEYTCGA